MSVATLPAWLLDLPPEGWSAALAHAAEAPWAGPAALAGGAAAALAAAAVARGRRRRRAAPDPWGEALPLRAATRRQRLIGWASVIVVFGGGGLWAGTAPLASAAVAPAVVSPEGKRKTVQHLEGGIIRAIHVREGSAVREGDALVTLEDVRARAENDVLRDQHLALRATVARLEAEQAGAPGLELPAGLAAAAGDPVAAGRVVATQRELFAARRAAREGRQRITAQRVAQLRAENESLVRQIATEEAQRLLIDDEIAGVQDLLGKGLERKPRLLALQRTRAGIDGEQEALRGRIASNEQTIAQTELEELTAQQQDRQAINTELDDARVRLDEVRNRLPSSEDALARTVVRAPIEGDVVDLKATTVGGVLRPGEPILDLLPSRAELLIEARLPPNTVKDVRRGLPARVVLTAYPQRNLPIIEGVVREVSADRLVDERTGEAFFKTQVAVDAAQLAGLDEEVALMSGMPAEVMIITGERTFLDYLLRPFYDSVRRAFRER